MVLEFETLSYFVTILCLLETLYHLNILPRIRFMDTLYSGDFLGVTSSFGVTRRKQSQN
jgi:hypothetical protein